MIKLSRHMGLDEATYSETAVSHGIKNKPTAQALINMVHTASILFEPLRETFGRVPLRVSSFYRSAALNNAIVGAKSSVHMDGRAIDIPEQNGLTTVEMYQMIKLSVIKYDKVIIETDRNLNWIHIQIPKIGAENRMIAMTAYKDPATGEMIYSNMG